MQRHHTDDAPKDDAGYPGVEGFETDADCQTGHANEGEEPMITISMVRSQQAGKSHWKRAELVPDTKAVKTVAQGANPEGIERTPPKRQTAARASMLGVGTTPFRNRPWGERHHLRKLSLQQRSRCLTGSYSVHAVGAFSFVKLPSGVVPDGAGLVLDMPHLGRPPLRDLAAFVRR